MDLAREQLADVTPARFIQTVLQRINNTNSIPFIARYLYMISSKELRIADAFLVLLRELRGNLRYISCLVLFVSGLFKFTRNPHRIVTTYRHLTDKACPFNIAKRLFLALSSTQVCCHFVVTFVPFLQQTQMQEAFRVMTTKARRAELSQAQR